LKGNALMNKSLTGALMNKSLTGLEVIGVDIFLYSRQLATIWRYIYQEMEMYFLL